VADVSEPCPRFPTKIRHRAREDALAHQKQLVFKDASKNPRAFVPDKQLLDMASRRSSTSPSRTAPDAYGCRER